MYESVSECGDELELVSVCSNELACGCSDNLVRECCESVSASAVMGM